MKVTTPRHLPDGWSVATIEDVAEVNPRLNKADIPDNLPVSFVPMPAVGAGNGAIDINQERLFSEVKKGFTSFQEGDVLFAKITPCMENGKMAVVPKVKNGYGFGSTEFHVLRPKEGIDARYLYYYISNKSFRNEAAGHMAGAVGQKRVPTAYLKECKISVAPLDQQKRIVAEIEKQFSRLDGAVANLKRVKANLKRYKAAVLKAAVEGKLVSVKNMPTKKLGEVTELVTKGSSPNWQGFDYTESGIIFVRSQNVGWGKLDLSDVAHLPSAFNKKERKSILKTGDVLLNIVGASIGRTAVVIREIEGGNVNQAVAVIRLNHEAMLPKFLMYHLLSSKAQTVIHAEKVDVARANISLSDIKDFTVPSPPLIDQQRIVAEVEHRLSIVEELEKEVIVNLQRAERLRQSILGFAFSGKLVQQNTDAELGAWSDLPLAAEAQSLYKNKM